MVVQLLAVILAASAPLDDSAIPIQPGSVVEKVGGGFRFVEGPAWSPRSFLLFSDIPADRIVKLEGDGSFSDFVKPSGGANGLAFDAEGNLYACQGGARKVIRIAPDGSRSILADSYGGKKLNSPNDLDLDGAGGLFFTDPRYGGNGKVEQDVMGVYHVGRDGEVTRIISDLERPNGILVSADGKRLYVANPEKRALHHYPIIASGKLGVGKVIFRGSEEEDGGGPDGMALDEKGNIYATYKSLVVLDPDGNLLGRVPVPERPANCAFGGKEGKTLYITARTGLYRLEMKVAGAPLAPAGPAGRKEGGEPAGLAVRPVTVDGKVGIGYGLAIADMDGDGKPDILLADKDVIAWYRNPGWEKSVIAKRLTELDHVCIAAADLDGDRKAEVAAGAGWNPGDTVGSGSVHYLIAPAERTGPWEAVKLHHEPTVHRMRWARAADGKPRLVVVPLHGKGNKNGEGDGVKVLAYKMGTGPRSGWETELMDDTLHVIHNLEIVQWDDDPEHEVLLAAREGVYALDRGADGWKKRHLAGASGKEARFRGASEVRTGRLPGGKRYVATIEPFHGNALVAYAPSDGDPAAEWEGHEIDATLNGGHALGCGDLLDEGSDQIVAGWRLKDRDGKVGIRLYAPLDGTGKRWQASTVDLGTMACEDLGLADLNADGRLDIIAAGRDTHNLVVYFNEER